MPRTPFHPFRSEAAKAEYVAYRQERDSAWPVPSETLWLETPSGRTFVRASGRASDPPLVLLPGARVSSSMWSHAASRLSAQFRLYAPDVAGDAGLSVRHADIAKPEDFVTWLDEILAVLAPDDRVSLVGMSLGGAIAAQYAVRFPQRVRRIVLLAPGATVLPFSWRFYARFTVLSLPVLALGRSPLRRTCAWLFADALEGDAACRQRAERAIEDAQRVVRLFALRPPPWPKVLTDDEWRAFGPPCLFLVGENEKIYSARAALARLERVAPQVRAEMVPGAGHDLVLVHPDRITSSVLEFMGAGERVGEGT